MAFVQAEVEDGFSYNTGSCQSFMKSLNRASCRTGFVIGITDSQGTQAWCGS